MENDDRQVGRILSRREVLALFGTAGAAMLAGCVPGLSETEPLAAEPTPALQGGPASVPTTVTTQATPLTNSGMLPACVVRPEQTEGPYFVDERLNRSDIRSDPSTGEVKEGLPLQITVRVSQIGAACLPLAGAQVDIWHCDALGVYSDATDPGFNTVGLKFLRGYQVTDANRVAQFTTIYPGWYQGRTVHIHFKIRTDPSSEAGYEFTSQLFFDDALTDQVHAQEPYASKGQRTLRNDGDGIYRGGGDQLMLQLAQADQGYAATFDIGLQTA
jgi:protocatechuate 3,4-dioxygenase beta subunit